MTDTKGRSCDGKVGYATHEIDAALTRRYRHGATFVRKYRCKRCGLWHVGHFMPPRNRRSGNGLRRR